MNVLVDGVSSQVHTGVLEEEPQVHCIYYERVFMLNHLLFSFYISAVKKNNNNHHFIERKVFPEMCTCEIIIIIFKKQRFIFAY